MSFQMPSEVVEEFHQKLDTYIDDWKSKMLKELRAEPKSVESVDSEASKAVQARETNLSRLANIRANAEGPIREAVEKATLRIAQEMLHTKPDRETTLAKTFLHDMHRAGREGFEEVATRLHQMERAPMTGKDMAGLAKDFADSRNDLVRDWHARTWNRFRDAVIESRKAGEGRSALRRRLHKLAGEVSEGSGKVVVETESQAAYGAAQYGALIAAGWSHKAWISVGDDLVRHSHAAQDQEEVAINDRFTNGLLYPGDPEGPPEETCSCRCWLVGAGKREATA